MDRSRLVGILAAALAVAAGSARSEHPTPVDSGSPVRIGSVHVDADQHSVSFAGRVNQVSGAVELLVCGPGGKTHESVFLTEADPLDVQAALLLIGLEQLAGDPCRGDPAPPASVADIWIDWSDTGTTRTVRAESTLFHLGENAALPASGWVLTGSASVDGVFMASETESLIATYCDPWAVLNLRHPASQDDSLLTAHPAVVPPLGTEVSIRILPRRAGPVPGEESAERFR